MITRKNVKSALRGRGHRDRARSPERESSSSQAQTDDRQPVAVAYWDQALHELIRLVAGSGE